MSSLDARLSRLSSHERAFAESQMARAEALADFAVGIAAVTRKVAGAVVDLAEQCSLRNSRHWPHAVDQRAGTAFPSTGLQH